MDYRLTYAPRPPVAGVKPKVAKVATAAEAWVLYQQLTASDEEVSLILDPEGTEVGWQELRASASRDAN